jgi:RNase H-like domain found in reverse transcriptase
MDPTQSPLHRGNTPAPKNNYPVHERELLAIVYALKVWRPYLHGSRIVIKADNHHLCYLDTQRNLSKRDALDGNAAGI